METIGSTLERLLPEIEEGQRTAQSLPATGSSGSTSLIVRLDDAKLAQALAIAHAPLPPLEPAGEQHLVQCLRVLLAALPKRASDDVSGDLLIKAYQRKLSAYPRDQINFLADKVLERCQWFPTIAECVEIMGEWRRDDQSVRARREAKLAADRELQARFDDTMAVLARREMGQDEVDALPESMKRIAAERGYLALRDGQFVVRPETGFAPVAVTVEPAPAPRCRKCQDVGRILTLEGEEADCDACAEVPA